MVNNSICKNCTLKLTKEELKEIIFSTNNDTQIISYKLKIPKLVTIKIKGNRIPPKYKNLIKAKTRVNDNVSIFDLNTNEGKLNSYLTVKITQ